MKAITILLLSVVSVRAVEISYNRDVRPILSDNCFACHKMNGGGEATVGPDLNLPMNPTEYFQPSVLPRYLRDPSSVRHWADQKMPAVAADVLSDRDLEAIIAYLAHLAGRR